MNPPPLHRARRAALALAALAALALAALPGCDAGGPGGPDTPPPIGDGTLPAVQQALVVQAFEDVEALFALGYDGSARSLGAAARGLAGAPVTAAAVAADTTTYTGVYNATASKGYLVTLEYRQPQGVGIWRARVQHARAVDHDGVPATPTLAAVETVTLTFLTAGDLDDFLADLEAGAIAYLLGTSNDAEAAFAAYDTWSVAQLYSPGAGLAVVNYTNTQLREAVTVRTPVVTLNADGTGTVRDGGAGGAVRTRYFGADFAVNADGSFTGTLLRSLLSSGVVADGAVTSRTEFPDGSWRQTKQRGGDGVVVRENTQG